MAIFAFLFTFIFFSIVLPHPVGLSGVYCGLFRRLLGERRPDTFFGFCAVLDALDSPISVFPSSSFDIFRPPFENVVQFDYADQDVPHELRHVVRDFREVPNGILLRFIWFGICRNIRHTFRIACRLSLRLRLVIHHSLLFFVCPKRK